MMKIKAFIVILILTLSAFSQNERYELGKKTRALEVELEKPTTPEVRKKAMSEAVKAVQSFFSFNLREAARDLDNARFALGESKTPQQLWAESLSILPNFRLIDAAKPEISLTISKFYESAPFIPNDAVLRVRYQDSRNPSSTSNFNIGGLIISGSTIGGLTQFPLTELPTTKTLSLKRLAVGDYFLIFEIVAENKVLATTRQMVSISTKLDQRLKNLETKLTETKTSDWQTESACEHLKILTQLAQGKTLETDYEADRMLNQAEVFTNIAYRFGVINSQMTLTFPLKSGNQTTRILIPKSYDKKRELPLVIALHGAGGSENLFFDSYGNGKIVRLCEKRGWFLAAPRNFGFNAEKLDEFIENLAKFYKIDRQKIFLIGHSLGSIQSLNLAMQRPKTFAGVALISTGGAPKISEELKSLPFFIGTGTLDFSFGGSQNLYKTLTESGVKRLEYKPYADVEHLTAVQFSLNDVFGFFDDISAKR